MCRGVRPRGGLSVVLGCHGLDAVWYAAVRYAAVFDHAVSCPLYLDVTVLMRCGMPRSWTMWWAVRCTWMPLSDSLVCRGLVCRGLVHRGVRPRSGLAVVHQDTELFADP